MKKLLIIDDEFAIVDALEVLLGDEGYDVSSAANGREGLAAFETLRPDLVICDIMMPVMGGVEFLRRLRETEEWRAVPVIFMSAVHTQAPAGDPKVTSLRKPFQLDDLLTKIESALN
jgi:CheY-like chemotaxis protein